MLLKFILLSLLLVLSVAIEPLTTTALVGGGVVSLAIYGYNSYVKCHIQECCSKPWVYESPHLDFSDLFGQPLAVQFLTTLLKRRHFVSKPVAVSFHGPTGTGKTFLSNIVAKMLYSEGLNSSYFHLINSRIHFSNPKKEYEGFNKLISIIKSNLTKCEKSVFVFEEFEYMPSKAVSAIASFLDPRGVADGVNNGQVIFIFLSNIGEGVIMSKAYELWKNNVHRHDYNLRDFENIVKLAAEKEKGPFKDSELVRRDLIDAYVPFLPLERQHVKACIEREFWNFHKRSVTPTEVEEILANVPFSPEYNGVYADTGCRKVVSLLFRY